MQTINQLTKQLTSQQNTLTSLDKGWNSSTENTATQTEELIQSTSMVIGLFEDWQRMFGSKLKERQYLDLRTAELWAIALKTLAWLWGNFRPQQWLHWTWNGHQPQQQTLSSWQDLVVINTQTYKQHFIPPVRLQECEEWPKGTGGMGLLETSNRRRWGNLERSSKGYINYFKKIYEQVINENQAGVDFVIKKNNFTMSR